MMENINQIEEDKKEFRLILDTLRSQPKKELEKEITRLFENRNRQASA